jgi:di/tricarboxylate transporter
VLLVQGSKADLGALSNDATLLVLDRSIPIVRTAKAPLAVGIFLAVVLAAAFGVTSLMVSAMCGVGLMLVGRCLSWDESWRAIDTRLVLVIVASLALGTALSATGATDFLARSFSTGADGLPPAAVIFALLVVTALLTEVVTNNAIAVIATPIAISLSNQLDLPATPFVLAVLFGSNMSFLTPIGYQTNLLVLTAGGYKFSDFARAGLPLQILLALVLGLLLPALYL